jgi:hypothetical protein
MNKYFCVLLMFACGYCNAQAPVPTTQTILGPLGLAQFSPLYQKALDVYFAAAAAYRKQDYATAQKLLRALWSEAPHGDRAWKELQRESAALLPVADFGTPAAYSALRMLTDCVEWRLKNDGPASPESTLQLTVVLVGKSAGPEPDTPAEFDRREGRMTTNTLDAGLDGARGEQIVNDAYWLFDEYILAITGGRTRVKRVFVRLPDFTLQVGLRQRGIEITHSAGEQVWAAVPENIRRATDWWHLFYPSHVPKSAAFANKALVTGGMRRGPAPGQSLCFVSEDLKFLLTANQNGRRPLRDVERSVALSQWLQHEFFHYLFSSYPQLRLEATSHQWHDRKTWPADFTGNVEADYYAEALHKRLAAQIGMPLHALIRHGGAAR